MGRVLIFLALFVGLVIVLVALGYWLQNRQTKFKLGLTSTKQRIRALESDKTRYADTLREIRQLADAGRTTGGDPLWDLAVRKIDETLNTEEKR